MAYVSPWPQRAAHKFGSILPLHEIILSIVVRVVDQATVARTRDELMEALPLHPKLVHLPIALAVLMPLLTSGLLLAWWRGWFPKRTWVLVVAAQAALLASGIVSMRTGEDDEERVERIVPESFIETHEEAAEVFVWGSGVVLALALLPFLLNRPGAARVAGLGTAACTLVVLVLGFRVGESGGDLVYRHGAGSAFTRVAPTAPPVSPGVLQRDHADDDR